MKREAELKKQQEKNNKKPDGTAPTGGSSLTPGNSPGGKTTATGTDNKKPDNPKP